jgi:hypothetical protein
MCIELGGKKQVTCNFKDYLDGQEESYWSVLYECYLG